MGTDIWSQGTEVASQTVTFGTAGDKVAGTKYKVRRGVKTQYSNNGVVCEFRALDGEYHAIDKKTKKGAGDAIKVVDGNMYSFFMNPLLAQRMETIPDGHKFVVIYNGEKEWKSGNVGKDFTVRDLGPDTTYQGEGIDVASVVM